MSSGVNPCFIKIAGNLEEKMRGVINLVYTKINAFLVIPFIQFLGNIQLGSKKSAAYKVI
jgi:hypothetical protein